MLDDENLARAAASQAADRAVLLGVEARCCHPSLADHVTPRVDDPTTSIAGTSCAGSALLGAVAFPRAGTTGAGNQIGGRYPPPGSLLNNLGNMASTHAGPAGHTGSLGIDPGAGDRPGGGQLSLIWRSEDMRARRRPARFPANAQGALLLVSDDHEDARIVAAGLEDARRAVIYLVVQESDQYIAIMEVLESSITDLTPDDVGAHLNALGTPLPAGALQTRLDKLREWGAISARTDASRILQYSDLLARNWRYTATPAGRQVQRFYRKVLAGAPSVREIPLSSLARLVQAAEELALAVRAGKTAAEHIGPLFVNHDDLDAALVGAEDNLAALVDRFDLNDESTAELKTLLVGYATHVAVELERGSARVYGSLSTLRSRFPEFAQAAVRASDARLLIERGALGASHGGRAEDWEALLSWCHPDSGRSARFALRLVRALPGMHVNLRRLHSSTGAATNRTRALALAKACIHPRHGTSILMGALGDHSWRKLHSEADELEPTRIRSWRDGPYVEVPGLLRATGRAGPRGRAPAARDDTEARDLVRAARARRAEQHASAIHEVLAAGAEGACLSERAARVALASLLQAVRATSSRGRRVGVRDGLACTLFHTRAHTGVLVAPAWRVLTPGRLPVFHLPNARLDPPPQVIEEQDRPALLVIGAQ